MGFWEWAGTSDATAVITGVFGTGGLGGVVLLITRPVSYTHLTLPTKA